MLEACGADGSGRGQDCNGQTYLNIAFHTPKLGNVPYAEYSCGYGAHGGVRLGLGGCIPDS